MTKPNESKFTMFFKMDDAINGLLKLGMTPREIREIFSVCMREALKRSKKA